MMSNAELMDKGISCLIENLGTVDTERFISVLNKEKFDYTKWQRDCFDDMTLDELNELAAEYDRTHPFIKKY